MKKFYTHVFPYGSKMVHRYVENGVRKIEVKPFEYEYFVPATDGEYTGLYGDTLKRFTINNANDLKDKFAEWGDIQNIHGINVPEFQFIARNYTGRPVEFDMQHIKIINFDIETEIAQGFPDPDLAEQAIISITCSIIGTDETITWTTCDYREELDDERSDKNTIILCNREVEILEKFIEWYQEQSPDALTGWNIEGFDIPFVVNRLKRVSPSLIPLLSPCANIVNKQFAVKHKEHPTTGKDMYKICGVSVLDYIDLVKKFSLDSFPDFRLETVAQSIIGEGKVDYGEYDNLKDFYLGNPTKFIRYNIKDVVIVNRIEQLAKYLYLAYVLQYFAKCNTNDIFGQVKFWEAYLYNFLYSKGIQTPPKRNIPSMHIEGGYVAEPRLGLLKWVVTFDLTSLYPMCIRQYNIGPDTIVRGTSRRPGLLDDFVHLRNIPEVIEARELGLSLAANGSLYRKDAPSMLSQVVAELFNNRDIYKNQMKDCKREVERLKAEGKPFEHELSLVHMYDAFQYAMKIAINSLYGALGNDGFRYYDPSMAEAITQSGQLAVKFIGRRICEHLDEVLGTNTGYERWPYTDTDSVFVILEDFVNRVTKGKTDIEIDKIVTTISEFCKRDLDPFIAAEYAKLAEYMNAYNNHMKMKREVIANAALFRAKKNYIMQEYDNEDVRYTEPKLKMMGIETARSTTPEFVKMALVDSYKIMLNYDNEQLISHIKAFKEDYFKAKPDEISTPRGVNSLAKYATASNRVPYHVKAAMEYNRLIREKGLKDLTPINEGDKVRLLLLKNNSPVNGNYIAYVGNYPRELGLTDYIDYEGLFEKTFLSPVESFTSLIGWQTKKVTTLDSLFG